MAAIKRLVNTDRGRYVGQPDNRERLDTTVTLGEGDRIIGRMHTSHTWLD